MLEVTVEGLDELIAKAEKLPQLMGGAVRSFFEKAAIKIEERAKRGTPVFQSRLRSSITYKVAPGTIPLWAIIGTNVSYAPHVEFGTRPHWPPKGALQGWADRHGIPVFLVMRAIARRGTPAKKMFQNALAGSRGDINRYLAELGKTIEQEWGTK